MKGGQYNNASSDGQQSGQCDSRNVQINCFIRESK